MEKSNEIISKHLETESKPCDMFPHTNSTLLNAWNNAEIIKDKK